MSSNLSRRLTPEEQELEKKRHELSVVEAELVERELNLATVQAGYTPLKENTCESLAADI